MPITLAIVEDLDEVRGGINNLPGIDPEFKVLDTYKTGEEASVDIPILKPDIVIMDINLPGYERHRLRSYFKEIKYPTQFMMFTCMKMTKKF
jgi:DNA-binding NarL/FixJ family response regulator